MTHEMQARNSTQFSTLAAHVGRRLLWLLFGSLGGAGCLVIQPTDGVLLCGTAPDVCPSGYQCGSDQHCWRSLPTNGSIFDLGDTASPDLSVDLPTDGSPPVSPTNPDDASDDINDLASSSPKPIVDLAVTTTDLPTTTTDLAMAPADMAVTPADMAFVFNYCPPGALFCDNFENETVTLSTPGIWTNTFVQPPNGNQILTIGTSQKHDGSHALHAASSLGSNSWSTLEYKLPKTSTALTLRLFVWSAAALVNRGEVARIFNGSDTKGYQVGASSSGKWFVAQNLDDSLDKVSTVAITNNAWSCLELVVPTSGNVQLFVNGTQALSFAPTSVDSAGYDTIHAGVEWAPANVPVDVWIDQVTLGSGRLPCP